MNHLRLFLLLLMLVAVGMAGTVMVSLNGASASASTEAIELVSKLGGATNEIAVQGNYTYFGEANWLTVVDVSAPDRPVIVGRSPELPGIVHGLAVDGSYAYVISGGDELHILDIANPSAPKAIGLFEGYEFYGDPVVNGTTILLSVSQPDPVYTSMREYGLLLLDISNPIAPAKTGYYPTESTITGVAVVHNYAYILTTFYYTDDYTKRATKLHVLDVSNPAIPSTVGSVELEDDGRSISVSGGYLYVGSSYNLQIIDVSTPTAPAAVGSFYINGEVNNLVAMGNYLFLGVMYSDAGLQIINISTPPAPILAGSYDGDYWGPDIAISNGKLYVAEPRNGFAILDINKPTAIERIGYIELIRANPGAYSSGNFNLVDIEDGYAYLLPATKYPYESQHLQILDVTDPKNPYSAGFPAGASLVNGISVDVDGDLMLMNKDNPAYMNSSGSGFFFDLSDRMRPKLMSGYSLPLDSPTLMVEKQRGYILDGCKLRIFSLNNPDNPTRLAALDLSKYGGCGNLIVSGYLAYLMHSTTLSILDLTNPAVPTIAGKVNLSVSEQDNFSVSGNYVFVKVGEEGWIIVDVSDPKGPAETGFLALPEGIDYANSIISEGQYAYVNGLLNNLPTGLWVFDLSDPTVPEKVAFYATRNCRSIYTSADLIYCAGESTVLTFRHSKDDAPPTQTPTPITVSTPTGHHVFLPLAQYVGDYGWPNTSRVSVDSSGRQANGKSTGTDMSSNGRYVVFDSEATNLVPGDTNSKPDVFVHDLKTGQTTRVSVGLNGAQGNNVSWGGRITADGRYVVFNSYATTLVSGDTNGLNDIFVHDRQIARTTRLSVTASGTQANGRSRAADISPDGRYVVFESQGSNLAPGKPDETIYGIFLLDRQMNHTTFVGIGYSPEVSIDGLFVAYFSGGLKLYDRVGGNTRMIHSDWYEGENPVYDDYDIVRSFTMASEAPHLSYEVYKHRFEMDEQEHWYSASSYYNVLDDKYVIEDEERLFIKGVASNGRHLVYSNGHGTMIFDSLQDGWLVNISATHQWFGDYSNFTHVSNDGRIALFNSAAEEVVPNDTNGVQDVFIRDRGTP